MRYIREEEKEVAVLVVVIVVVYNELRVGKSK